MTEIDVSNCTYYVEGECDIYQDKCDNIECTYKSYKRTKVENKEIKACLDDFNKPEVKKVLTYYNTGELDRLEEKCEALEAENNKLKTQYNCYACGSCKGKEDYINLEKHHKGLRTEFDRLHREIRRLKWYLNEIRYQELATLDIEWDEYETGRRDTEYTNIIELVQEALDEVPEEDCRYHREEK